jgi:hypothetical protein
MNRGLGQGQGADLLLALVRLQAAVAAGGRVAANLDRPLGKVDDPVIGNASLGVKLRLLAAVVLQTALGNLDN